MSWLHSIVPSGLVGFRRTPHLWARTLRFLPCLLFSRTSIIVISRWDPEAFTIILLLAWAPRSKQAGDMKVHRVCIVVGCRTYTGAMGSGVGFVIGRLLG